MKTQMQAIDPKTISAQESNHQTEQILNYPGANKEVEKLADYSSMQAEIQKINDPVSFEALKSFYHIS